MTDNATLTSLSDALARGREDIARRDFVAAYDALIACRERLEGAEPAQLEEWHYCMGVASNGTERPGEAIGHLNRSLQLAEASKDVSGQARSLEELGAAHHQRSQGGDYRTAEALYERALKLYQKLEDKAGQARNLRNMGGARVDLGLTTAAQADYAAARTLFKEVGDSEGVATCVTNGALLTYRSSGRVASIQDYRKALEVGDGEHYLVYNNLGFLLILEGELGEARTYLEKGLADCEARSITDDNIGLLQLNLGILAALEQKHGEAESLLVRAEACFEKYPSGRAVEIVLMPKNGREAGFENYFPTEDADKRAVTITNRAVVAFEQGHLDRAEELLNQALELEPVAYPRLVLGWLRLARGDEAEATMAFRKAAGLEPHTPIYRSCLDHVNPYLTSKAGRNDPCPCGSGKKFKKCHGALK